MLKQKKNDSHFSTWGSPVPTTACAPLRIQMDSRVSVDSTIYAVRNGYPLGLQELLLKMAIEFVDLTMKDGDFP